MDGVHDMGGMHGFGLARTPERGISHHEPWELRAQVLGLLTGSANRPAIEGLAPATYLSSSYYVRWLLAAEATLVRRGQVDPAELDRLRTSFAEDPDARPPVTSDPHAVEFIRTGLGPHVHGPATSAAFAVGDRVRVRRMRTERHHRCPRYVRGVIGEVERVCGADPVPGLARSEEVAEPVYTVRFASVDLFGDTSDQGEPPFVLLIDLWERYLEVP